jgi:Uma2 family endonuclease
LRPKGDRVGFTQGAPDLAIEVASPSNTKKQMGEKAPQFLEAGSKLVWVFYPVQEEIHVFQPDAPDKPIVLKGEDVITGEDVIPDFSCRVAEFFED